MTNKHKLKCLFGHHNYKIPHKINSYILICNHCKRFGYYKGVNGREAWCEYNEKGDMIRSKWSNGLETWYEYDEKRNMIYCKGSDGDEVWYEYNEEGNVIKTNKKSAHELV